jgi:hypothetical protein
VRPAYVAFSTVVAEAKYRISGKEIPCRMTRMITLAPTAPAVRIYGPSGGINQILEP